MNKMMIGKLTVFAALATSVTFGLFAFMAYLIASDQMAPVEIKPTPIIDVAQRPEDSKAGEIERVKPVPPEPKPPMPRETVEPTESNSHSDFAYKPTNLALTTVPADIGIGQAPDNDARPIVQVNPKYPPAAARDGKEGWVVMRFDINELGEVENIKVIDAEPKRLFDSAARKALKRWKYQPKMLDGKAVTQQDITVQLDFKMEQQA